MKKTLVICVVADAMAALHNTIVGYPFFGRELEITDECFEEFTDELLLRPEYNHEVFVNRSDYPTIGMDLRVIRRKESSILAMVLDFEGATQCFEKLNHS